ncbi:MAG TPA: sodium:solute symporter [Aliidongia sp.]|nr:sodium:solute symporter [Aliidongia sp.]
MLGEIGPAGLGTVDWLVVGLYMLVLVGVGLLVTRQTVKPVDYFLASRSSTWPRIGLALFASNISSTALVGLAGAAYAVGISVYDYEWVACLILVFFCVFLLPFILRSQVYTMPEFLERRYDGRARLYFALMTLFLNIFVDSAGGLYSGALVCRMIFPETPLWMIVAVLAGIAATYTILGGLRAVIYTEIVQAVVLLAGALVTSIAAFRQAGGWETVMRRVDPAFLSLIRPIDDPGVPWPGLLFGVPILGFYYWCTNQFMIQRVISAKSLDHGRWGVLLTGLLKLPVLFLMVLPGTCAILIFPNLPKADLVYPALIFRLLPAGMVGLVVAGFLAATMASVAATLNSASTLITMDVVRRLLPRIPGAELVRVGRIATAAMMILAVCWAPQLELFPSLWQYLQTVLAYAVPPVVALFLVGLFWRGANASGAAATLILGSLCGSAMFLWNEVYRLSHLHFLYVAPVLLAIDTGLLVLVSLWRGSPCSEAAAATIWTPGYFREESARLAGEPPWRNYRVLAILLLALAATLVIWFR